MGDAFGGVMFTFAMLCWCDWLWEVVDGGRKPWRRLR